MGPKKKPSKNGFFNFMEDVRKREEKKGRTFSNKKELADFAGPIWNDLDSYKKQAYADAASEYKCFRDLENSCRKFNSLGISYAIQDAEEKELSESIHIMKQIIITTVSTLNENTIKTYRFYFCHVNYYFKTDSENYCPAELALTEFNLEDGLIANLHVFFNPGVLPLGVKYEARKWAEKTHGIPLNWNQGISDYKQIYNKVLRFLTKYSPIIPPVYTMPDSLNNNYSSTAVKCTLSYLAESAEKDNGMFRVYELPLLFLELRNKVAEKCKAYYIPTLAIAENELEKDIFAGNSNLGCCSYHEEMDLSIHCSLSIVRRWVYMICDYCCGPLNITPVKGKHFPEDKRQKSTNF